MPLPSMVCIPSSQPILRAWAGWHRVDVSEYRSDQLQQDDHRNLLKGVGSTGRQGHIIFRHRAVLSKGVIGLIGVDELGDVFTQAAGSLTSPS